jgi:hypothetical protein
LIVPSKQKYPFPPQINVIRIEFGTNDLLHGEGVF